MKRAYRFIVSIIVVLIALSSFLVGKGFLEIFTSRKFDSWLSNQPQFYTSQMSDETKETFVSVVRSYAQTHKMILITKKTESITEGPRILTVGVLSSPGSEANSFDSFDILGTQVINRQKINELLGHSPESYLGYGMDTNNKIGDLPYVLGSVYFKLDQITPGYNLGNSCAVLGLSPKEFDELVGQISEATGLHKEKFITNYSGSAVEVGLFYYVAGVTFIILSISFCLLTYYNSLQELKKLGVHVMLGWSKSDYVVYHYFFYCALAAVLLPLAFMWTMVNCSGFDITGSFLLFTFTSAMPAILVVVVSVLISAAPLLTIRPVDAILGRLSQKGLYVLTTIIYTLCCVVVFAGSTYMDAPITMYSNLLSTQENWSVYKDWYIVRNHVAQGNFFNGRPMDKSKELFDWYKDHEHNQGVYIAHVNQIGEATLNAYGINSAILKPFDVLIASPSYLKEIGVALTDEQVKKAENGTRIYLVPSSYSEEQKSLLRELVARSDKIFESDIVTPYMQNPSSEFIEYDMSKGFFTWSTSIDSPSISTNVVIKVVTSNNMVPSESESLVATGLDNSYIKLSPEAAANLLDSSGVVELSDDGFGTQFSSIESFIKDYRKSLQELFLLFGVVIVLMFAAITVIQISMISIVQRLNERKIAVECMLGFGIYKQYINIFLIVNLIALVGTLCMIVIGSTLGIIMGCLMLLISNLTISISANRSTMRIVLENLSKE